MSLNASSNSETSGEDTGMSSVLNQAIADAYEPDDAWEDCSLCDAEDCQFDSDRMVMPAREAMTSDIDTFLQYVLSVQAQPRGKGETPFNEQFWIFVKRCLETAAPIGYTELPNRYDVMSKGPLDNGAFIQKYLSIAPLNPIYPNVVAEMSGVPLNDVLTELVYASTLGMVTMRFTPVCDRCGSPTCAYSQAMMEAGLKSVVGKNAFCRACRFVTPIDCMEKIKVIFLLNTEILYVLAENLPCKPSNFSLQISEIFAMVPATFSGSGFQFSFGCDGDLALRPAFRGGKYRMHCTISLSDAFLLVERDASEADEPYMLKLHVSDLVYRGGSRKVVTIPHGKCRIQVFCDTKSFFILWIQPNIDDNRRLYLPPEERVSSISAMTIMSHLAYKSVYQGSQEEAQHFAGAVAQMQQIPDQDQQILGAEGVSFLSTTSQQVQHT